RRLERIVEQRTQKIREDKELIEAQARQLQELDQVKSRFFTNISHEFRTPLTVISGMVTQMRQQPEQWLEKGMELIQRNSSHLLTLINQILDLRKLESGALKVHWVQGDIIPFCRYLADSFSSMAQLKGIRLHFQSSVPELVMDYDPDKMLQILSNLLSNAIKYAPGPAEIFLEIDRTAIDGTEALLLRVRDTGPGIRPQALPFIFDQFYQADPLSYEESTHKPAGSGVGLALTKELVELLGGTIEVASVLGEGTTFTLKFPILRTAKVQALRATLDIQPLSTDSPPQDKAPVVAPPTVTDHSSPEEKIEG
ncbi:MAG: HAMP domain-containing histidine kinase, partial [Saprospiraceae bacterium]|nr:HAMP domain-containing histidine kinase [Saprospiraceae bacterium]